MNRRRVVVGAAVTLALAWTLWPQPEPTQPPEPAEASAHPRADKRPQRPARHAQRARPGVPLKHPEVTRTQQPLSLPPPFVDVEGTVENAPPGETWVTGCGKRYAPVAPDGTFRVEAKDTPCVLRAARKDGLFTVFSDPIYLEEEDEVVDIDFVLPTEVQGGMGIQFETLQDGILVAGLSHGGAAAESELQPGDVIVAIDGVDTAGMDMYEFIEHGLGNVGTEVSLTVDMGGEERQVTLVRREL